ncbi:restriction endonuclease subunit S [Brevibacillus laterosporus]|uniref:restriction endonuclease subunit S n=1 Tax=Brevibacillus laterosporus TaxID=1465 RepID=UPI00215C00A6|nr:restriction endonuclease subunit S [Brevibacillus laterosporus]MCR8996515.1 restriction endonuclease subunit S [Brevibacillus laterosporus]
MTSNKPKIRFDGFTNDWEQQKLGELAEKVSVGIATSSSEYFTDSEKGVPFIKNQNIKQNRIDDSDLEFILKDFDQANSTKRVKKGDILTVRTGYPGLSAVVPPHLDGAQTFTTLITRLKEGSALPEFVSTFINSDAGMKQITGMEAGGAQKNVNAGVLQNLSIPIPSLDEQKIISKFFSHIDDTIALHQCKQEKLINLKTAMLKKMFPQNGKRVPEFRLSGFTDDWEQLKLGEHSEIKTGGTPKTGISEYWFPKEIPWMSSGEVNKKRLFNTDNQISEKGLENSSARWIKEKSILIALAGQGKTRGTVAINEIPLTTNQSIAAIEVDSSLDSEFVFQNLEGRYEELRLISSGDGTRGGLNKQLIADLYIIAPSVEEQSKIGMLFKQLDLTISLHREQLNKLQQIKKSMLQKMFV